MVAILASFKLKKQPQLKKKRLIEQPK